MKKISAPQPSEAAGSSVKWRCTARSCRGMSAAATNASTRQNAVCTIQPISVKPHHGRTTVCCVAQFRTGAQFTLSKRWTSPVIWAPGSRVSVPPEKHDGRVLRRQSAADDRRRRQGHIAAEGGDLLLDGASHEHVAAERHDAPRHGAVDGDVSSESADIFHTRARRHSDVLTEPDDGSTCRATRHDRGDRGGTASRWPRSLGRARQGRARSAPEQAPPGRPRAARSASLVESS